MQQEIAQREQLYTGILELDPANVFLPGDMGLAMDILDKRSTDKAGIFAKQLDKNLHASGMPADAFMYYLTGNAASIQLFRSVLKARGVESRNIRTQPYWAAGKRAYKKRPLPRNGLLLLLPKYSLCYCTGRFPGIAAMLLLLP